MTTQPTSDVAARSSSQQPVRVLRRTAIFVTIIFLVHFVGAYALDAIGLIESLLSPTEATLALVLPLACVFYSVRLALYFVIPGFALGAVVLWAADRWRSRTASH